MPGFALVNKNISAGNSEVMGSKIAHVARVSGGGQYAGFCTAFASYSQVIGSKQEGLTCTPGGR